MNMKTQSCPCCGNSLLRHASHGKLYWFCTSCWQEVPIFAVSQKPLVGVKAVREYPVKV